MEAMKSYFIPEPGLPVTYGGERYVITHILSLESVLAKSQDSGKTESLKISDLLVIEDTEEDKTEIRDLVLVSEEEWKEAFKWFKIIEPLLNTSRRTQNMVAEAARAANV